MNFLLLITVQQQPNRQVIQEEHMEKEVIFFIDGVILQAITEVFWQIENYLDSTIQDGLKMA